MTLRINSALLVPTVASDTRGGASDRPRMGSATAPYLASALPDYVEVVRVTTSLDAGEHRSEAVSQTL
jgi:hypothetical protein